MKDVRGDLGGHPYSRFLAEIAKNRNIRRYLEIGVAFGANLSQIACETAIGVDPAFGIKVDITQGKSNVHLYRKTSDRFFRDVDVCSVLGGPIEMAFLDGLHLFEYLLRDFYNTEALCAPESLIAIHDCLPVSPDATSRTNTGGPWTGDVWKLVPILKTYRPDLNVILVDCPPTGLVLATGLDPCSRFLRDNYLRIVREFAAIPSDDAALRKFYSEYELVSSGEILHGNNHTLLLRI